MEHQPGGGWHEVREKHSKMPDATSMADRVIDKLRRLADKSEYAIFDWWLKEQGSATRGDESTLQIDIEDAYFIDADRPPIALEWPDFTAVAVDAPYYRITLVSNPAQPAAQGYFERQDELRWEFTLPQLSPGTYRIETSPSPHDSLQSAEALFDVFDDATIERASDHA